LQNLSWQRIEVFLQNSDFNKFLIAISGGVDSSVLLHLCHTLKTHNKKIQFRAVHINHQLQQNATIWDKHCEDECKKHDISFISQKITINTNTKKSPEEQARIQRYQAIKNIVKKDEQVLCAHHLNDQVETFFLRLLRGSGSVGLSGIKPRINIFNMSLARPFLNISQQQINDYATTHQIKYIVDDSNADIKFTRNYLRLKVMPSLDNINTAYLNNINKAINIIAENNNFIDETLLQKYKNIDFCSDKINSEVLNLAPNFEKKWVIRYWLSKKICFYPNQKHTEEIITQLINSNNDNKIEIKLDDNHSLKTYDNVIYLVQKDDDDVACKKEIVWVFKEGDLKINQNLTLTLEQLKQQNFDFSKTKNVKISYRQEGQKMQLNYNGSYKKLKKIFQEYKIPPWMRDGIPLLYLKNELVAIYGVVCRWDYRIQKI